MRWLGSVAVHSVTAKLVKIDTTKICKELFLTTTTTKTTMTMMTATATMTATITTKTTTRTVTELLSKVKTINIFL